VRTDPLFMNPIAMYIVEQPWLTDEEYVVYILRMVLGKTPTSEQYRHYLAELKKRPRSSVYAEVIMLTQPVY